MFLLFLKVTSADESNGDLVPQVLQQLQHFRRGRLPRQSREHETQLGSSGGVTRRAGVRVPSTSKRTSVFLIGRSDRGTNLSAMVGVVRARVGQVMVEVSWPTAPLQINVAKFPARATVIRKGHSSLAYCRKREYQNTRSKHQRCFLNFLRVHSHRVFFQRCFLDALCSMGFEPKADLYLMDLQIGLSPRVIYNRLWNLRKALI